MYPKRNPGLKRKQVQHLFYVGKKEKKKKKQKCNNSNKSHHDNTCGFLYFILMYFAYNIIVEMHAILSDIHCITVFAFYERF